MTYLQTPRTLLPVGLPACVANSQTQVGSTICMYGMNVIDGLFTTLLDFGVLIGLTMEQMKFGRDLGHALRNRH